MKNTLIILFCITFFAVSCKDDEPTTPTETTVEAKDYSGIWSGEFKGGDGGLLEMTVASDNSMTGRGYSTQIKQFFTFSGNLNTDGSLDGAESNLKTTFSGQFSDSTATGTWTNLDGSIKGDWNLKK